MKPPYRERNRSVVATTFTTHHPFSTTTTIYIYSSTHTTSMEDFDYASRRVTLSGIFGALAGVGTAMYKGHPLFRTTALTAASCAMAASACFGTERLAAFFMRGGPFEQDAGRAGFLMTTYSVGGALGGSILGAFYIGKPLHGFVFFAPIMTFIGFADSLFQDMIDEGRLFQQTKQAEARARPRTE